MVLFCQTVDVAMLTLSMHSHRAVPFFCSVDSNETVILIHTVPHQHTTFSSVLKSNPIWIQIHWICTFCLEVSLLVRLQTKCFYLHGCTVCRVPEGSLHRNVKHTAVFVLSTMEEL